MVKQFSSGVLISGIYVPLSITIILLPIPMLVLALLNVSWLINLPSTVRHTVEEALGPGYIGVAVAGILGSAFWIIMFLVLICVCPCATYNSRRNGPIAIPLWILFSMLLCAASWVVYVAKTPWHPESNIPEEALSTPTVVMGLKQILALKYMIVINLCFIAIWSLLFVTGVSGVLKEQVQRQPNLVIPSRSHAAEDGVVKLPPQGTPGQTGRDLETGDDSESNFEQLQRVEERDTNSAESLHELATMDGAG